MGAKIERCSVPPAPDLSAAEYARCFRTYRSVSGECAAMLNWVRKAAAGITLRSEPAAILSVGCGAGDFDLQVLRVLARRRKLISYVGLEPHALHRRAFAARLVRSPLPGVRAVVENKTFETYAGLRRFDLIFMTHCLYYIPDRERAIRKALALLRAAGCLVIFHQTARGIDALQRKFLLAVKGRVDERFSSRDLQAILDRCGIGYRLQYLSNRVDVSACFKPASRIGRDLLSFFFETDARHLPPPVGRAVRAYLKKLCVRRKDRWLMNHPMAVFAIRGKN